MTQSDFARHFLTVCNTLGVWEYDEPGANADALDAAAARVWKLWLIPGLFDGFDPTEWRLTVNEQSLIRDYVSRYREVTEHFHTTGTDPTAAELSPARIAFRHVYRILRAFLFAPYLFSPDLIALHRDCRRIVLDPNDPGVGRWAVSADLLFGNDSVGDPALFVWVVVPDQAADNDTFWEDWEPMRMRLQQRLWDRVDAGRHVYLSVRTVGEVIGRITGVSV